MFAQKRFKPVIVIASLPCGLLSAVIASIRVLVAASTPTESPDIFKPSPQIAPPLIVVLMVGIDCKITPSAAAAAALARFVASVISSL